MVRQGLHFLHFLPRRLHALKPSHVSVLFCGCRTYFQRGIYASADLNAARSLEVHPLHLLSDFFFPSSRGPHTHPHTIPHCCTLTPTHALIWPLEKPVTVSGPLCHGRINYLSAGRLSLEFISEAKQRRCRGHGASLLNYSSSASSLPSPLCLSPTLFCQLTTRATVARRPVSNFWYRM